MGNISENEKKKQAKDNRPILKCPCGAKGRLIIACTSCCPSSQGFKAYKVKKDDKI